MKWYDFFANFYDQSLEKLYFQSRQKAVEQLDISEGQIILDLACGTGANFKHLAPYLQKNKVFGTDFSPGMLRRAQTQIQNQKWQNIQLFQADARDLNENSIEKYTQENIKFDRIICVLGLSVIPDWEKVLDNILGMLNIQGKIVIVDVFAEKRTWNTWLVEKIAKADLNRAIWQKLQLSTQNFQMEYLPVKESKVGGKLFVAVGTKK